MAKKIKNGARKIVLDKAEEARVAAFSAFKSLGYNVPHFSHPVHDQDSQEAATTSSGDDARDSFVEVGFMKHDPAKPSAEEKENSEKAALERVGEKVMRTSDIGLVPSAEVNSEAAMQCNIDAERPVIPVAGSETSGAQLKATVGNTKSADTIHFMQLQNPGDKTSNGYPHHGVQEPHNWQNLCLRNENDSAYGKGPMNALTIPGGFDSFLDLWETASEFYFDVHYNKRLEVNSAAPFEIHGIAICWENSPVYYVNLPKDLMWSESRRDDYRYLGTSGYKGSVSRPENWLEIVGQRWNRIGEILGKRNVRKFTWNLKVQIQVLKVPAVSVQKFGSDVTGKSLGLELIDNSYLLLTPIHIKDGIDACIVSWILWPDEERSSNPNLEKVIRRIIFADLCEIASMCNMSLEQMKFLLFSMCKIPPFLLS